MRKHVRLFDIGIGDARERSGRLTEHILAVAAADFGLTADALYGQYNTAAMGFDGDGRMWIAVEFFVEAKASRAV